MLRCTVLRLFLKEINGNTVILEQSNDSKIFVRMLTIHCDQNNSYTVHCDQNNSYEITITGLGLSFHQ